MKEIVTILESKGIATASDAVRELMKAGVLTGYDVSVYLAQQEFMRSSVGVERPTPLMKDIAHKHSICWLTLRRSLEVLVTK